MHSFHMPYTCHECKGYAMKEEEIQVLQAQLRSLQAVQKSLLATIDELRAEVQRLNGLADYGG